MSRTNPKDVVFAFRDVCLQLNPTSEEDEARSVASIREAMITAYHAGNEGMDDGDFAEAIGILKETK